MKKILIKIIRGYQRFLSPIKRAPSCKYYPTCSNYAIEALEVHGVIKGSLLAIWRILRCNPFSKGGVDPVPQKNLKEDIYFDVFNNRGWCNIRPYCLAVW